ncbi:MAG: hypothetical protein COA92_02845 [Sulfurovum sp.]|nr:MAG: hypothetical protein COA92_02845 [Sulfurovum sp.]
MQNLGKLFLVYMLSFGLACAASVKATVNTVEVFKGNPVTLYIKATGDSVAIPQITTVADAPVIGISKSTSRNLSIANGSVHSEKTVSHVLQFVPEDDMTIPSFTVRIDGAEYQTETIDIKVVTSQVASNQSTDLFSLRMQANKTKVRVGESFFVTVYFSLHDSVRLSQEVQYTPPRLSDFVVTNTEESKSYKKRDYKIQEIGYIVTAQKEGNFTISPAQAKIGLPERNRRDMFGLGFGTKWVQTLSNSLDIEVLPQVQESDLLGEFTVESTIDAQEVKANKPVNFTIKIEGKGNLEGFEFLKYDIDGVTVYSDEAKVDTKIVDRELYSIYTKSFAFISDRDFVIPERNFSMLSLTDNMLKQLTVSSYAVTIKQDKHALSTVMNTPEKSVVQTKISQRQVLEKKELNGKSGEQTVAWWMLLAAFVSGALFMYLTQLFPRLKVRKASPYSEAEALKILYAHMSEDSEVEAMVRKLYAKKNGDKLVQVDKKELKEMVERFR